MRIAIAIALLVSMGLAYTPMDRGFRVTNFGTPIHTASWQEIKDAHPVTQVCMLAAWGGTAFVFGSAPWWDSPKVKPWVKVAAGVAIGGFVVGMATSGLSK